MTYARSVDQNQAEIVADLRRMGYQVAITSRLGEGKPDIMVADENRQVWVEVKMPGKKLTEDEIAFHEVWPKNLRIVAYCTEDVLLWFGRL